MTSLAWAWMFLLSGIAKQHELQSQVFTTVLVVPDYDRATGPRPCFSTSNTLKQHLIRPFQPWGDRTTLGPAPWASPLGCQRLMGGRRMTLCANPCMKPFIAPRPQPRRERAGSDWPTVAGTEPVLMRSLPSRTPHNTIIDPARWTGRSRQENAPTDSAGSPACPRGQRHL